MRKGGKRLQLTPLAAPPKEKGGKRLQRTRPSVLPEQRGGKRLRIQQRRTHGKPRGVMASAILLAVSVAVVAGVTFGWFDLLRETQAGAVVLKSEGQTVNVDGFTLFTYEDEESGISADKTTITLKSYDSVFGRNENTPVYILIPVSGDVVSDGKALNFELSADGDLKPVTTDDKTIAPYFSNVAQLRYVVMYDSSDLASYEAAHRQFYTENGSDQPDVSTAECFASFAVVKDDSGNYVLKSDYSKGPVVFSVSGYAASRVIYVLLELDYNADLMTSFVKNHTSDTSGRLDLSQQISFDQDTFNITVSASQTS